MRISQKSNSPVSLNMPKDVYEAYKKDFQNGFITVGNVCGADCLFCSQKWNPPGVTQDLRRFLTMEEIKHFTNLYLDKVKFIGTALHVNSGEFFLHPNAAEILHFLAAKNKSLDNVETFTNGMDLSSEHIKIIKKLNISLCLSLNSADVANRKKVMGNTYLKNKNAIDSIHRLDKYNVNYQVWLVPLRSAMNNGDMENSIRFLKDSKAKAIKIHRPGYSKHTPPGIRKELAISDIELFSFVISMRQKYKVDKLKLDVAAFSTESRFKDIYYELEKTFKNKKYLNSKRKLFLCSEAVKELLPLVLKKMQIQNYKVMAVKSRVFGGSVNCAGLLLVEDYIYAIKEFLRRNKKPEVIILPGQSFDKNKEDLSMVSIKKIKNIYKTELILVDSTWFQASPLGEHDESYS